MQGSICVALLLVVLGLAPGLAQEEAPLRPLTERLDLSGRDGSTKPWSFEIDSGRRAGESTTIGVPGHWETQGFGTYAYGRVDRKPAEVGRYRTEFEVPPEWAGKSVRLVFGGVMTDAEVRLNGDTLGVHQGGFTEFGFDVSDRLGPGANRLEVDVYEASRNRSVNRAERDADYWTFGGIYRPVWLEARPRRHIAHVAADPRADGTLQVEVETEEASGCRLASRVLDTDRVVGTLEALVDEGGTTTLAGSLEGVRPWSAETPFLYDLETVLECTERPQHEVHTRIGFRSIEVRPGRGLFVNERRVVLKGVNRHSFWPDSGRTLTVAQNRADVELIKSLHFNAVRASHYPPDKAFLDACDEIGLYVLDELPGWQDAYDTRSGTPLVAELVRRDVNHPSVIAWNNGNEDGWNTALDPLFAEHDPQDRLLLHPRGRFGGFETEHYPDWDRLQELIDEPTDLLLMPTEFLHALYDGGGGASLRDYWTAMSRTPRFAGGFLWAFLDEAVLRSDTGELDAWTNFAPDGIVGPYRELEPSAHTVRSLFAPVQFAAPVFETGLSRVEVHNQHHHVDLSGTTIVWQWVASEEQGAGLELASGELSLVGIGPGRSTTLELPPAPRADAFLSLRAVDASGRETGAASWPLPAGRHSVGAAPGSVATRETELVLDAGPHRATFDRRTGALRRLAGPAGTVDLGLELRTLDSQGRARVDGPRLLGVETETTPGRARARMGFDGPVRTATWTLHDDGRLSVHLLLVLAEEQEVVGLQLLDGDVSVDRLEWIGRGPTPVWRNRLDGPRWGLWTASPASEPRERGYFGPFRRASLSTSKGDLEVATTGQTTFLGVETPELPEDSKEAQAVVTEGVTVLSHISAIGTKFHPATALGPTGAALAPAGLHRLHFSLRLPDPEGAPEP